MGKFQHRETFEDVLNKVNYKEILENSVWGFEILWTSDVKNIDTYR